MYVKSEVVLNYVRIKLVFVFISDYVNHGMNLIWNGVGQILSEEYQKIHPMVKA